MSTEADSEKELKASKKEPMQTNAEELEKALQDERKHLMYLQADFENYKRRISKELPLMSEAGVRRIITELLVVLDELDSALAASRASTGSEALIEGVELVRRKLCSLLEKEGLERIKAIGQKFDPNRHEALMQAPCEGQEEGIVVEEIRPGYVFKGQVIRPSLVKVTTHRGLEA